MSSFSTPRRAPVLAWPVFACIAASAACSSDPPGEKMIPTPEVVRNVYGLGDGSCYKYRFSSMGANLFATVTVSGPNTMAIAGHTVFVQKYQLESGGLPTEDYFEIVPDAEIRLLRHLEGQTPNRITKRYDMDPEPPLFAMFIYDRVQGGRMFPGDRFETNSTPMDMPVERHVWTVLSDSESATTPDGMQTAYKMQYNRGSDGTAVYYLVPGFGMAQFTDFKGVLHQVCAARVCDAAGACTGAASCMSSDLVCAP